MKTQMHNTYAKVQQSKNELYILEYVIRPWISGRKASGTAMANVITIVQLSQYLQY